MTEEKKEGKEQTLEVHDSYFWCPEIEWDFGPVKPEPSNKETEGEK